ncbi:TraI domain-containing protein [Halomonas sp. DP5N14-9]|uniref:MobH family relaxase n=1 Tax=Halomonas sp. DP5N14-9 TaxID=2859075 RepID=UPI001C99562C|nr:MobH family relaxase [Halomonas sp. DP5N14-9]MBY5940567.1 TraI domain-containing protein [Halomonas sp. DP5N14-9]
MLSALTRWLPFAGGGKVPEGKLRLTPAGDLEDDEIPRYPPFAKGLPAAPIEKVLLTQRELITRIQQTLGLSNEEFERLMLPVLQNYAEFVHLLPASEAHHHRGAGGLFRHGLEVAFWATQASEAVIFVRDGTPRERRNLEPCWRLAVCLAALLHDLGKPLSDVSVTDKLGKAEWNPYAESLMDWVRENSIERYFLRWNKGRHERHERLATLALNMVLTSDVRRYLRAPGPDLMKAVVEAISGTSALHPVTQLVLKADQESVKRDLKESRLNIDEHSIGLSIEPYIIDAIRSLVISKRWKVNVAGAQVWHLEQGAFIAWKAAAPSLVKHLQDNNVPAVPHDPDTLADYLIDRGFAVPRPVPNSDADSDAYYRYWEVAPSALEEGEIAMNAKILMLRMEDISLVFGNSENPPAPIVAKITGEDSHSAKTIGESSLETASEPASNTASVPHAEHSPGGSDGVDAMAEPLADVLASLGASLAPEPRGEAEDTHAADPTASDPGSEAEISTSMPGISSGEPAVESWLLDRKGMGRGGPSAPVIDLGPSRLPTARRDDGAASKPGPHVVQEIPKPDTPEPDRQVPDGRGAEGTTPSEPAPAAPGTGIEDLAAKLSQGVGMNLPFDMEEPQPTTSQYPDEAHDEAKQADTQHAENTPAAPADEDVDVPQAAPALQPSDFLDMPFPGMGAGAGREAKPAPDVHPAPTPDPKKEGDLAVLLPELRPSSGRSPKKAPSTAEIDLTPGGDGARSDAKRKKRKPKTKRTPRPGARQKQAESMTTCDISEPSGTVRTSEAKAAAVTPDIEGTAAVPTEADSTYIKDIPWRLHGEAGAALLRLVKPVLEGTATLGEAVIRSGDELCLLWPAAAQAAGLSAGALKALLEEQNMLVNADGRSDVQERDGLDVLVLQGDLVELICLRFAAREADLEAELAETSPDPVTALEEGGCTEAVPDPHPNDTAGEETHFTSSSPEPIEKPSPPIVRRRSTAEKVPSGDVDEPLPADPGYPRGIPDFSVMAPTPDDEECGSTTPFAGDESAIDVGLTPDTMTAKEALLRLKAMIIQEEGDWLVGSVRHEGDMLVVNDHALDRIGVDYPDLTRNRLRTVVKTHALGISLVGKENKLLVRKAT